MLNWEYFTDLVIKLCHHKEFPSFILNDYSNLVISLKDEWSLPAMSNRTTGNVVSFDLLIVVVRTFNIIYVAFTFFALDNTGLQNTFHNLCK